MTSDSPGGEGGARGRLRELLKAKAAERKPAESTRPDESTRATRVDPARQSARWEDLEEVVALGRQKNVLASLGLENPYFRAHEGRTDRRARIDGREYLSFSTYNYLGLATDPEVIDAVKAAVERYGSSASASRLIAGEKSLHRQLESHLAAFLGVEDSLALVSGHATNVTVIGHLFGPRDLILHDSLSHNSIHQGLKLSGARAIAFPHNDAGALASLLETERDKAERCLVVVEGVYSVDGDVVDLPAILRVARRFRCFTMIDEAHSMGVLGKTGHGVREHFGIEAADVDIWMGTLSKSLASCGGYIGGKRVLIEYLKYSAPGFVYSCGLTPADAAAADQALGKIEREPGRVSRLAANANRFRDLCRAHGLNIGLSRESAVVPVITGNSVVCLRLAERLRERGVSVHPILYPAVPDASSRLRFFVTSEHREEDLELAARATAEELDHIRRNHGTESFPALMVRE